MENATPEQDSDEERIAEAILAALQETGEELVRWCPIRDRLVGPSDPGDRRFWAVGRVLLRLHGEGKVYLVQIGGAPFVGLGDECDAEIAARYRARSQLRPVRVA